MVEDSRSSISNAPASSSSDSSITDKERLTILWNEYKDQADWQRHNEVQRASLSNIMLVISAALIAFSQRDPSSRTIPLFLIVIGVFGVIAVSKYWERFMYHVHQQRHLRRLLDSYFPRLDENSEEQSQCILIRTRETAKNEHIDKWSSSWWTKMFTDSRMKQHWLWIALFGIIASIGVVLLCNVHALPSHPLTKPVATTH